MADKPMPDTQSGTQVPDEVSRAVARVVTLDRITAATRRDYESSLEDAVPDLIMEAVTVAAPLIVAAELDRLATYYEPETDVEDYDQGEEDQREAVRSICRALRRRGAELRSTPAKEDSA